MELPRPFVAMAVCCQDKRVLSVVFAFLLQFILVKGIRCVRTQVAQPRAMRSTNTPVSWLVARLRHVTEPLPLFRIVGSETSQDMKCHVLSQINVINSHTSCAIMDPSSGVPSLFQVSHLKLRTCLSFPVSGSPATDLEFQRNS